MRHMFGCERQQILKEKVVVFRNPLSKCYLMSKMN